MKTKKNIYDLHEENKNGLSKLEFYIDELLLMQKRIEEIAQKNNSIEVRASVEHFQNQLIIQKEQADILAHDIRKEEAILERSANKNPTAIDHQHFPDQLALNDRIQTFDKIFMDLRKELQNFASKWM